jgi:predicted nucleic acid-binding protein
VTTAVDTSVLLDLLTADPQFVDPSERALREAARKGRLVICDVVVTEIRPSLGSAEEVSAFLEDLNIEFVPSSLEVALVAGSTYQKYLSNRGPSKRVVPDFLVAAHALCMADALLARDRGYYRSYFTPLVLVEP